MIESEPAEFDYSTRIDVNIAILREMQKIRFRERLQKIMPLVAKELVAAGVNFSGVDFSKITDVTEADIDLIFEDLGR